MARKRLAFDKYLKNELQKPSFAAAYEKVGREIEAVDGVLRAIDEARIELDISKAELARRVSTSPTVLRRLLTSKDANPSFATILGLLEAVGLRLAVTEISPALRTPLGRSPAKKRSATEQKRVA